MTQPVQIVWDSWAVPTITAVNDLSTVYGMGYAQATLHATAILELYGIARGTSAALWGPAFIAEDTLTVELGLPALIDQWYDAQLPETLERIRAFCEGFNAACDESEDRGTDRRGVLPVTPRDVIAHTVRVFVRFSQIDPQQLAFAPDAFFSSTGSNGWAVSARLSATGNAMLVINPHLAWGKPLHRFVELHTISPGRDFNGIALIGLPWQSIGYSAAVGWGHTVNPIPNLSVYELELSEGRYPFGGQLLELEIAEHKVEVLGEETITVLERRSVHGPVITAPDGVDVAVRIAGVLHFPAAQALESWWQMSLASSVEELLATQDAMPLPLFNLLAADASGSIAAAFCGTPPVRTQGDFDDSKRRLPGGDPSWLWDAVHPASTMPRVVNPECGWVQNCNETPWYYTDPVLKPDDYPAAIAPSPDQVSDLRPVASRHWLMQQERISPGELFALKLTKRALLADIVLEELCRTASADPELEPAIEVLRGWDRHAHHDSGGYVLFWLWAIMNAGAMVDQTFFTPVSEPGAIPSGLADPAAAVETLKLAVTTLTGLGVPLAACMGDVCTLGTGDETVRADGGSQLLGILKCLEVLPTARGIEAVLGDTWVSLVQFQTAGPAVARSLLVYGNSTEPSAPPSESQWAIWAADQLRPRPS